MRMYTPSMQVVIAERCYAALGDISRTRFLHKVVKQAQLASKTTGDNGYDSYSVSVKVLFSCNALWAKYFKWSFQHLGKQ